MRFQTRALLIVAGTVATFFLLPRALMHLGLAQDVAFYLMAVIVAIGANGLLYLALRCPQCRKWACQRPDGRPTVLPGRACRYCAAPY